MASTYQIVRFNTNGGYIIPEYDREYEYEVGKTYVSQKAFPPSSFKYVTGGGISYVDAKRWGGRNGRSWRGYSGTDCGPEGNIATGDAVSGYIFWNSLAQPAFLGWYTSPTGGTRVLDSEVCNLTRDITLYAHWDFTTVRLLFDPRGGEFIAADGSRSSDVITQTFDLSYDKPYGRLPRPYRKGYIFEGWHTLPKNATLESFAADIGITPYLREHLYPEWAQEALRNYPPGGFKISAGVVPAVDSSSDFLYGVDGEYQNNNDSIFFAILLNGWRERAAEDFWEYYPRLYAHWNDGVSSAVKLDYQGGEAEAMSFAISEGENLPTLPVPTRSGYAFLGYYTGANRTGEKYADENANPISVWHHKGDITLFAAWQRNPIVVTMVRGGRNPASEVLATISAVPGSTYGYLPNVKVKGYKFIAWRDSPYTSGNKISADSIVPDVASMTLYGEFSPEYYPVIIVVPRPDFLDWPRSYSYQSNIVLYLPEEEKMKSHALRIGFKNRVFVGWYDNPQFLGASYTTVPTNRIGAQIFYAKWENSSCTVTFRWQSGDPDNYLWYERTVEYGAAIGELLNREAEGFVFDGWYDELDRHVTPSYRVVSDMELHGKWREANTAELYYVRK